MSSFVLPPLPHGVDAIRTIKVEPGDFSDPLICTLNPVAFGAKPKYVALSYTWGDPYPDNAALPTSPADAQPQGVYPTYLQNHAAVGRTTQSVMPTITLDGSPFPIGHNLYLALLHLRSLTEPLTLWVDAVCINQNDLQERNSQVALMSFIYTRATAVVVWLGVREHYRSQLDPFSDPFRSMAAEWKAGQVQHLAATLANKTKHRFSPPPDHRVFSRLAESSYWTRLWVVQELCLPRVLFLVYGPNIWTYEDFLQWEALRVARTKQPSPGLAVHQVIHEGLDAMLRLIDARAAKFSDAMRLENLLELFARNRCTDLRDRVYGLLGLANDVHPVSRSQQDDATKSIPDDAANSTPLGHVGDAAHSRRGIESLQVDYRLSFYDIWANVVDLIYCQAKTVDRRSDLGTTTGTPDSLRAPGISAQEERYRSIVRTSAVIQTALGQSVQEEHAKLKNPFIPKPSPIIRAIGYLRGQITELGPDYTSLIASARAQQDWVSLWTSHHCHEPSSLATLRRLNEEFMARLIAKDEQDLDLIREIRTPKVIAWPTGRLNEDINKDNPATGTPPDWVNSKLDKLYPEMWNEADNNNNNNNNSNDINQQQQLQKSAGIKSFIGTDHLMGLVPPAARAGDWIVRFWNCDAAIVVRSAHVHDTGVVTLGDSPRKTTTTTEPSAFLLVGRADVAELHDWKVTGRDEPPSDEPDILNDEKAPGLKSEALYISLDLPTLQVMTSRIQT
ncbi:Heterokaryon incompatibility protein (HET) domain containing protein [Naviculisporaceae sp. PSN 640]